jgi:raffinose/stachyose/melibiose transport system permease protein
MESFGRSTRQTRWLAQAVLTFAAVVFLVPLVSTVAQSLQRDGIGNYFVVLSQPSVPNFFLNSTIVSIGTVTLITLVTLPASYAFAKLEIVGKNVLYLAFLLGLLIPGLALILPAFQIVKNLDMFNSYLAVILPLVAWSLPFSLLIARGFMEGISNDMLDAAMVDGAGSLATFFYIVVPLSRPIVAVIVIWSFLLSWNEYFLGLVFMTDESMQLITQLPSAFESQFNQDWAKVFAALVIISIPVIVGYLLLHRQLEEGMSAGSSR